MRAQGSKDLKDPNAQEPKLLAEAHQTTEAVPVAAETVPAQVPPAAAPVQVRNIDATVRTTPHGAGEHQVEVLPLGRNLILLFEHPFGVELTCASAFFFGVLFGSLQHCVPNHRGLVFPKECVQSKNGLALKGDILDELPSVFGLIEPKTLNGHR